MILFSYRGKQGKKRRPEQARLFHFGEPNDKICASYRLASRDYRTPFFVNAICYLVPVTIRGTAVKHDLLNNVDFFPCKAGGPESGFQKEIFSLFIAIRRAYFLSFCYLQNFVNKNGNPLKTDRHEYSAAEPVYSFKKQEKPCRQRTNHTFYQMTSSNAGNPPVATCSCREATNWSGCALISKRRLWNIFLSGWAISCFSSVLKMPTV